MGQGVDGTAILVRSTYYGDANLSGALDGDDYALLDRGYALYQAGTIAAGAAGWVDGDFNYDGVIDANDFVLVDRAYYFTHGGFAPGVLAEREAEFGPGYVEGLVASVPEPGVIGMFAAILPVLVRRRKCTAGR
jgi:hypothetical protein